MLLNLTPIKFFCLSIIILAISCNARPSNILFHKVIIDDTTSRFLIRVNKKCGFIDNYGKEVINPQFAAGNPFSEGLAFVKIDRNNKGYINSKGDFAIRLRGYAGLDFHEGLGVLISEGDSIPHTIIIDKKGSITYEGDCDIISEFSESLAVARSNGKFGYVDKYGAFIIKPSFGLSYPFANGLARVYFNGSWGYIGMDGHFVIEPKYSLAEDFAEGLAAVKLTTKNNPGYVYIDLVGNIVIDKAMDYTEKYSEGLAFYAVTNGAQKKFGFIDKNGQNVIPEIYSEAKNFSEGVAPVIISSKWGYINKEGKTVIPPKFDYAGEFNDGLAFVAFGNIEGYINHSGTFVWEGQRTKIN